MEREIVLRIILENPPAGVDFGLQKGKGNDYQTVQTQRSGDKDLSFEFSVGVKEGKNGSATFVGPFAQGPPLNDSSISISARWPARPTRPGPAG